MSHHINLRVPPEQLPGVQKKSFAMSFGGGEIWFEHLDGMYGYGALAIDKLIADAQTFRRPSMPSLVAVNLDETVLSEELLRALVQVLTDGKKRFTRVVFVGLCRPDQSAVKRALRHSSPTFALAFINDFQQAKEWLISECG